MLTALMTKAIKVFAISLDGLHNDATTLHMPGEYSSSVGDSLRGSRVRFGHAKGCVDLAQLICLSRCARRLRADRLPPLRRQHLRSRLKSRPGSRAVCWLGQR